jgi:stage V sporulation protein D (sporulation-specific penicillin-binding protein)
MVDASGNIIEENQPKAVRQVISESTSATMRDLLESVVSGGSGEASSIAGYKVGGKTGTAQKYDSTGKVAEGKNISSFVGFAPAEDPELVVLILVDEPGVPVTFGSKVAAPHVRSVLENALKYLQIPPSDPQELQDGEVSVPNVVGKTLEEAMAELENIGLSVTASGTGTVQEQAPTAKTKVSRGSEVLLYMSTHVQDPEIIEEHTGETP